jgi:hypothetical protein
VWWMRTASPPISGLDLAPPLADRFVLGVAPSTTARYFSAYPSDSATRRTPGPSKLGVRWLQVRLACLRLSPSCPKRLLHTFLSLRPARRYPRFWVRRSSSERRRDSNPPDLGAARRTDRIDPTRVPRPRRGVRRESPSRPAGKLLRLRQRCAHTPCAEQGYSAPSTSAQSRAYRVSYLARRSPPPVASVGIVGRHNLGDAAGYTLV